MLLYVGACLVCRFGRNCSSIKTCTLDGHLHRVTQKYTKCRINTIDSPDDKQRSVRNMQRIGINIYTKKELCVKLVIYKNWTEMHGQSIFFLCLQKWRRGFGF